MFEAFDLQICHTGATHRDGGVLNLVAARDDVPVSVVNVECSDHSLLHWPAVASDQPTILRLFMPVRGVDLTMDLFRSRLMSVVDRLLGRGRRACDGVGISVMDKAILSSYTDGELACLSKFCIGNSPT